MNKRLVGPGMATLLAVTAAGCGPDAVQNPTESWTQPAWMAEQIAQREEYQANLQSCLTGKGWSVTVDINGGIAEALTMDEGARLSTDIGQCRVGMGLPIDPEPVMSTEQLSLLYQQQLDVRECLLNQGVVVSDPPSEDSWIDAYQAYSANLWLPYSDLYGAENLGLTQTELEAIERLCPQPWSAG